MTRPGTGITACQARRINGGGTATRAEAEQECRAAIAFAHLDLDDAGPDAETIRFELSVGPGAHGQQAAAAAPGS